MGFANMSLVRQLLVVALMFAAALAIGHSGVVRDVENGVQNAAFALRKTEASGRLHVVEMDAASVAAIERWPWPRHHYARVVERLDAAGARSIVFDVDFSTPSDPEHDAQFARALSHASAKVVLPTFGQQAAFGKERELDALPIPAFRKHSSLSSVSVLPDPDGLVRQMPLGTETKGVPRPSLAAQIAHRSGEIGIHFPIDYAIDPASIPRHSFSAIESGQFDPNALRGKDVLIGATAIEMGDRYATPRYGVLPGVIVQALAAETLYRGVPRFGGWFTLLLVAVFPAFLIVSLRRHASVALALLAGCGSILAVRYAAYAVWLVSFEIVPALIFLILVATARTILTARANMLAKKLVDSESGLPNALALRRASSDLGSFTIAAMIEDFDTLKSVIGAENVGPFIDRLAERLRATGCGEVIYRVDDRMLAWESFAQHQDLQDRLADLKRALRKPVEVGGRRVDVAMVFGIAESGALTQAAQAASVAQREGTSWRYHERAERAALEQQVSLMGELDAAIERDELEVLYQPKLDLAANCINSAEALVRWHHPERGYLRPDSFIPLAEQTDRIADLTLYVLRRTILDLQAWGAQDLVMKAAVNISARLVSSQQFIQAAERMLQGTGIPHDRLIFEVTESATMKDPEGAVAALNRFRELGIAISMDDYGTGQSSLTYLKNLPLSELKIDRSFVQHAHLERNDALLVRSTVQLAHSLGLRVVAEGVEDLECLEFLREIKCDFAQGYYVAKPMRADDLARTAGAQAPGAESGQTRPIVSVAA